MRRLLILGLGNVICSDDGLGVAAVERLRRGYTWPDDVEVLDGGTLGLALMSYVTGADDLLLVDAIRADGPPGTLVRLDGDEVAPAVRDRLSVHQIGVADLLDGLHLVGSYPRRVVLWGLVPANMELGLGRTPEVEERIGELVEAVAGEAERLGYPLTRRLHHAPDPAVDLLGGAHRALGL